MPTREPSSSASRWQVEGEGLEVDVVRGGGERTGEGQSGAGLGWGEEAAWCADRNGMDLDDG